MSSLKTRDVAFSLARWSVIAGIGLLFLAAGFRGVVRFGTDWDYLAYHLPFSLMHVGMTTYVPEPSLLGIYNAFPPIAHIFQGLLALFSGNVAAGSTHSLWATFLSFFLLRKMQPDFPLILYAAALLSIPHIVLQLGSGYIDLWTSTWVALTAFSALRLLQSEKPDLTASIIFVASLTVAMLSKYQAWPFCALIIATVSAGVVMRWFLQHNFFGFGQWSAVIFIAAAIFLAWPVRNYVIFQNPTHPVQPPLIGKVLNISGVSLSVESRLGQMPAYLADASDVRRFVESAFELSRFQDSQEPFKYTIDQGSYAGVNATPHYRLGGWSPYMAVGIFLSVIATACAHLGKLARSAKRKELLLGQSGNIAAPFLWMLFVVFVATVPQSHELRYWTVIPIFGIMIICSIFAGLPKHIKITIAAFITASFTYTTLQVRQFYQPTMVTSVQASPPEAREYVKQALGQGVTPNDAPTCVLKKMPWTIFWAGESFNEVPVKACQ